ncbi:Semaphorin5Blike [Caligus rogercresseyi]|uniref:Semaphorin5Blike n=1 Tax=Caligus rogercresseyi TaxID=217165 RepID=A0A7T8KC33_CALRO|nr:Semaphorin5Blike [Caligus rogercresseyi]
MEQYSHLVVDSLMTNEETLHILFIATRAGIIKKISHNPKTFRSCLIEVLHPWPLHPPPSNQYRPNLKGNPIIATNENIVRLDLDRCSQIKTKEDCLSLPDPYCGWDGKQCVSRSKTDASRLEFNNQECPPRMNG